MFRIDRSQLLEAVLDRYEARLPARRSGWTPLHCINPDHPDRRKSASANLSKGRYFCHACDLSGDGYDLMLALEGMSAALVERTFEGKASTVETDAWIL